MQLADPHLGVKILSRLSLSFLMALFPLCVVALDALGAMSEIFD